MKPITSISVASRAALSGAVRAALCIAASLTVSSCSDSITDPAGLPPVETDGADQAAAGLQQPAARADAVLGWNRVALEAVRSGTLGPPMIARALAIFHTAVYDAWAAYDAEALATLLGDSLRRPPAERTLENRVEALSYAAYRTLVELYPGARALADARMSELGLDPANQSTDTSTPAGLGNAVAAALLEFRRSDGSNQGNGYADPGGFQPVNDWDRILDPNHWQPLRVPTGSGEFIIQECLGPHWGDVIPFALETGSTLRPEPPAAFPHGHYRAQAEELIRISARLTERQKVIAEYWADGPGSEQPPGHWNLFAQYVSERDAHSLEEDVKLFFALNNALMDAGIAAWEAKGYYDYVRPVTAIRFLKRGKKVRSWAGPEKGVAVISGEDWKPYQPETFPTPPFAEYVSGHSAFSAAAAEVLRSFTGGDAFGFQATIGAGSSLVEPGVVPSRDVVLSWSTFSEAADEAGISRRYGGIHFRDGDLEGRSMGRAVGRTVWDTSLEYFAGESVR